MVARSQVQLGAVFRSVADPYHIVTDPEPGCEKICYGSGTRPNFNTDPDPDQKIQFEEKTLTSLVLCFTSLFYIQLPVPISV